jgi:UrcA family protein
MKIALAALVLSALSLAGAAHAAPAMFPPKPTSTVQTESSRTADWMSRVAVRYDDLDLGRDADARFLLTRLEKAAAVVCRHHSMDKEMARGLARTRSCEKAAMNQALAKLKSPVVTRLHDEKQTSRAIGLFSFNTRRQPASIAAK